ncbi:MULTISPECIES: helix-turn-helix domain-containing protein [unclassified Variovorax]|uniref:helix-turn-helix domain-containing protein n=1 Tax=unclassified Variovorax TaxID=663243 RepID=UPI000D12DE90|nr:MULTISPECIES: helix-turn-helix domain-containing protein [unclassified Variovorax]AVQ81178.1 AraC family transcriptional regulator [Variovorax sp. PMC12]QRY29420.1 AraC family transcriptional regulator [Variovorax sp. PDNC026]
MGERLFLRLEDDPLHGPESAVPAGTLRAFAVGAALRGHVSHLMLYRETFADGHEMRERVLPDGAVRLVFNFGDAPSAGDGDGLEVEAIGASAAPVVVRMRGQVEGLSVTLRPGAAACLLGLPAGEIGGGAVHLDALWRGEGSALLERMAEAPGDAQRVALLHAALLHRLRGSRIAGNDIATHATRLIAASEGRLPLRDVAVAVGVGERRLQQLFHAHVGLSPRTWSRLARMHGCLRALRQRPAPDWADLALEGGFYDQSHLVNEFRALCGVTPTEFLGRTVSVSSKTGG